MPLILEKTVSLQLIINMLQIMKKYLKRHIDQELEIWAESQERKPLLLRGARQVGKTSTERHRLWNSYITRKLFSALQCQSDILLFNTSTQLGFPFLYCWHRSL